MTHSTLTEQIQKVIEDSLQLESDSISIESSMKNTASWDSIGLLNIITALEEHFSIDIDLEDAEKMISVRDISQILSDSYHQ